MKLLLEIRRRKVFRLVGLYLLGAWLAFQAADIFFPAWDIPETAVRYVMIAAMAGFPIALIFGWFFDISGGRVVRTLPATVAESVDISLRKADYVILGLLGLVALAIVAGGFDRVRVATENKRLGVVNSQKPEYSIAVLPFDDLNGDKDLAYFSDGVTEEILHRLSTTRVLKVLGRASSFAFKGSDTPLPKISDILQVRYLLQGSVRRDGNQIRITARLMDESGYQVWSESYDRKMEGVFAIQTDIANSVARKLEAEIVPLQVRAGRSTSNADAYHEYLLGNEYFRQRLPGWQTKALEAFDRAIALDPDFAPPYAGRAAATIIMSGDDVEAYANDLQEARSSIDQALMLDPDLAEAHAALGLLMMSGVNPDFAAAEVALRRAIEIDPTEIYAYTVLSIAIDSQGRDAEANAVRRQALAVDPLNPILNVNEAALLGAIGDFRGAERLVLRLTDLPKVPGMVYYSLVPLYWQYGRLDEAVEWSQKAVLAYDDIEQDNVFFMLACSYELLGLREQSDVWLARASAGNSSPIRQMLRAAYIAKLRGEYTDMVATLDEVLAGSGTPIEKMPKFAAEIVGAMYATGGRLDKGIEILEHVVDIDDIDSTLSGGSNSAVSFLQLLAWAHRESGQEDRTVKLLDSLERALATARDTGTWEDPSSLELLALNKLMLGNNDAAFRFMEVAVASGWRKYYDVVNYPIWYDYIELPQLKSLLSFVYADIERQRAKVLQRDAESDFYRKFEQMQADHE
jgi:TolB-like protein